MNQEKIGKFISRKRKEKKLTQLEFAEQLGVTDRSVSNWENGKNMPDLSLFQPICKILNITINDLMSGEVIDDKHYKSTFEQNVVNVFSNIEKKHKKNKRIFLFLTITFTSLILLYFIALIFYNTYEVDVKYDNRIMSCNIKQDYLTYKIKGISIMNTEYIEKELDNETILFIHNTINLYNKKRSHWEYHESMARLLDNERIIFSSFYEFNIKEDLKNKNNKVKVYYTEEALKKIKNSNEEDLKRIIIKSHLMCKN